VLMPEQKSSKFIPNGLWVPVPALTIKFLSKNHRPADRVLYALCLHLGKGLEAVFPSYPTVARYSCVGEKQLRAQYDKLVELGFISIEKKRVGKRFKNFYTILPKAWTFRNGPSKGITGPSLDPNQEWICCSCWEFVTPIETEYKKSVDWDGNNDDHWIHNNCVHMFDSRRVRQAGIGTLMARENELERREIESRRGNIS
jgi:hypothetical protein